MCRLLITQHACPHRSVDWFTTCPLLLKDRCTTRLNPELHRLFPDTFLISSSTTPASSPPPSGSANPSDDKGDKKSTRIERPTAGFTGFSAHLLQDDEPCEKCREVEALRKAVERWMGLGLDLVRDNTAEKEPVVMLGDDHGDGDDDSGDDGSDEHDDGEDDSDERDEEEVEFELDLEAEGGYVHEEELCRGRSRQARKDCLPPTPPPTTNNSSDDLLENDPPVGASSTLQETLPLFPLPPTTSTARGSLAERLPSSLRSEPLIPHSININCGSNGSNDSNYDFDADPIVLIIDEDKDGLCVGRMAWHLDPPPASAPPTHPSLHSDSNPNLPVGLSRHADEGHGVGSGRGLVVAVTRGPETGAARPWISAETQTETGRVVARRSRSEEGMSMTLSGVRREMC